MTVCYGSDKTTSFQEFNIRTPDDFHFVFERLHPSGCIVESENTQNPVMPEAFEKYPTVFLDRSPCSVGRKGSCVFGDVESIVDCAVQEFVSLGLEHYGFVSAPGAWGWCCERRDVFEQRVRCFARSFSRFNPDDGIESQTEFEKHIGNWLIKLPKPCGLLAANDAVGGVVLSAAKKYGISVPREIAVIGIDDDEQICENAVPTLSSVRQDFEMGGFLAAELLERLMADPKLSGLRAKFGAQRLVRRASSRRFHGMDVRTAGALEFIRLHACEGISPSDVVASMACSRRSADLRFHEMLGWSILDEIHAVRLAKAKDLLRDPHRTLSAIPDLCGYASMDNFRRVFRRYFGVTPREYRKQQR